MVHRKFDNDYIGPDRKAGIKGVFVGMPAETGQRPSLGRAKGLFAVGHGGFEHHRPQIIAVICIQMRHPGDAGSVKPSLFIGLGNRGYNGSYDAVRRYAAKWQKARDVTSAGAYVPLSFDPGEAYQCA